VGEVIGGLYELEGLLGSGGGGDVYMGTHLRLGKKVILKKDKHAFTSRRLTSLRREADALKILSHANIPTVYDFVTVDNAVYTVIDYIEGSSFDKLLKNKYQQPQVVSWARQLLGALEYLHTRPPHGILHSDIKPANLMLKPNGEIVLIDFNIALALGEDETAIAIGSSSGYASPEHYAAAGMPITGTSSTLSSSSSNQSISQNASTRKGAYLVTARSDIYGAGATLYSIIMGKVPAKDARNVVPLTEDDCSLALAEIINKSMSPDPKDRFQTATEMLSALNRLHERDYRTKALRRGLMLVSGTILAMFLLGASTAFVGLKQLEQTQASLTLSEYSSNALEKGDAKRAVSLALEALPENGIFNPEYIPQAQKALADALGVYDLAGGYKALRAVELPKAPFKIAMSKDGSTIVAVCAYEALIIETETGEIKSRVPTAQSALSDAVFIGNDRIAIAGEKGICLYDIPEGEVMWSGKPATGIAVSGDGKKIAGVYRDETFATIYSIDGDELATIDFEGRKQWVAAQDTFADPGGVLFALSNDGAYLAASFDDGSLDLLDTLGTDETIEIFDETEYKSFDGGFSNNYFILSAAADGDSLVSGIDLKELEQTFVKDSGLPFKVQADNDGVLVSIGSLVTNIDPATGKETEAAYIQGDVKNFASDWSDLILASNDGTFSFYDKYGNQTNEYDEAQSSDFVAIGGGYAAIGGMDTPNLRILKKDAGNGNSLLEYDASYDHDEARINAAMDRAILFSVNGFQLYDMSGKLLKEVELPQDSVQIDQQHMKKTGNLAVMYDRALRIYSGRDGSLIYEETGCKSVFYAPYGVSVLDGNGELFLVDADTGEASSKGSVSGDFAAWCGMIVDKAFLGDRKLIGAAETEDGFSFAVANADKGEVYNEQGKHLFDIDADKETEVFFTKTEAVSSSLLGTPAVYSLKNGKRILELEKDAYLAYLTQLGDYVLSDYFLNNSQERFGILLDGKDYSSLARLTGISDWLEGELVFDTMRGEIRKSKIYGIDELIALGRENVN
jgi:serine/threonine protein kinase